MLFIALVSLLTAAAIANSSFSAPDDSNLDNNNNNNNDDDDDDDTPQQAPPPKGVFARLRDKFASTFELGSLGSSQQGNGIPQVVSVRLFTL